MQNAMKRGLAAFLALWLMLSLLPLGAAAQTEDTLALGDQYVTVDSQYRYYAFVPAQTGGYIFGTSSGMDTQGMVCDENRQVLVADDPRYTDVALACELEAGKTYYLALRFAWEQNAYGICAYVLENPVTQVNVDPVTVMENTNLETTDTGSRYAWESAVNYTVTFRDGSVYHGSGDSVYYDNFRCPITALDQQAQTPWTPGQTYYPTLQVGTVQVAVPVTVVACPIARIEVAPLTFMEGMNTATRYGWSEQTQSEQPYTHYCWENNVSYQVFFKDGTSQTGYGSSFYYNGTSYSLQYTDAQGPDTPWTVGNTYTQGFRLMGCEASVPVTITPTPFESITFEPIVLQEHTGGYWSNNWTSTGLKQYYHYYWWQQLRGTVNLTDGTTVAFQGNSFTYEDNWYGLSYSTDQSYDTAMQLGNTYTMTVTFQDVAYPVEVTIAAPVEGEGFRYVVGNNRAIITGCTLIDPVLQIPETLDGFPVVGITSLGTALQYAKELVIPDSVTMLGEDLFDIENITLEKLHLGAGICQLENWSLRYAEKLESFSVAADHPTLTVVDGVLYNKAVTTMVAYPRGKNNTHIVPDSATDISILFNYEYSGAQVQTGAGTPQYVTVDGVVYDRDMTVVLGCAMEKTGTYVMPETVERIGPFAFAKTKLSEVVISPQVTHITYGAFMDSKLRSITVPGSVQVIEEFTFSGCTDLEKVNTTDMAAWCLTEFRNNPLMIAKNLYLNGEQVVDLVIPSVVDRVYATAFENANLRSVTIPESVLWIEATAFRNSTVETVHFSEGLTDIGHWAFAGSGLTSVRLPDSLLWCGEEAFADCGSLQSVTFGTGLWQVYDGCFARCDIRSLVLPENIAYVDSHAFRDNKNLTQVEFKNQSIEIDEYSFYNCPLVRIDLGKNTPWVGDYAFTGSLAVTLTIPQSVTRVTYRSFAGCGNLISVVVPETVSYINTDAFADCYQISHVYYGGTEAQWNAMACNSYELCNATVHFGADAEAYRVKYTCTGAEHYCRICGTWESVQYPTPMHNMVDGSCTFCGYTEAVEKEGWQQEDGKLVYYLRGQKVVSGWVYEAGDWYYLGADGYLATNCWVKDSVGWCYQGADGKTVYNKWVKDSVGWCYIGRAGYMVTDQWVRDSVGWCYIGSNGYMVYNKWVKDSVGWCYIGADGYMVTSRWSKDSVGWCYLDKAGYMVYNQWVKDSVGWCYVDASGYMVYNKWIQDGGSWYYVDASGYMLSNTSKSIGGKIYRFDTSGICTNP